MYIYCTSGILRVFGYEAAVQQDVVHTVDQPVVRDQVRNDHFGAEALPVAAHHELGLFGAGDQGEFWTEAGQMGNGELVELVVALEPWEV